MKVIMGSGVMAMLTRREGATTPRTIQPTDKASMCQACKEGRKHEQAANPGKDSTRSRIKQDGESGKAAANMVPPALTVHVGKCMRRAWEGA